MRIQLPLLCSLFLFACHTDQGKITPTVEDISESVYASGIIKSVNQYEVFSTVNGTVETILAREGNLVNKGTPILKLSNKTSALNAKNALLAAEYAKFLANKEKLDELRMAVDVAHSKKLIDSLLWQRQQNLWSQNVGTKVELEQRELTYQNSASSHRSAIMRYKELERQLELNVHQSENTLQINNAIAEEYTIKSEIKGKIYKVLKEEGEMAYNTSPIAIIGDEKRFLLELQVDETDIVRVKQGQQVFISMDSYRGQTFEAIVTHIDPSMNERSKSFTVEASFIAPPDILYPFLTVEANIIVQQKYKTLTIPRSYLVDDSFVITERKEKRKVMTGLKDYQKVEIIDGLREDESIILPEE
jgi:multidrug efflux pump subunit AcrA (membrane-fusion protein)